MSDSPTNMRRRFEDILVDISALPDAEVGQLLSVLNRTRQITNKSEVSAPKSLAPAPKKLVKWPASFLRLYPLPVPNPALLDYYIKTLLKSREFLYLEDALHHYQELERIAEAANTTLESTADRHKARVVKALLGTKAIRTMLNATPAVFDLEHIDRRAQFQNRLLLSFRTAQDGYTALQSFDQLTELPEFWAGYMRELNVPMALAMSRTFRDDVMRELTGDLHIAHQYTLKLELLDALYSLGLSERNVALLDRREVLIDPGAKVRDIITLHKGRDSFRRSFELRYFQVAVAQDGPLLAQRLVVDEADPNSLKPFYVQLTHNNPNRFIPEMKEWILNEELCENDGYFVQDGRLAKWVTEN